MKNNVASTPGAIAGAVTFFVAIIVTIWWLFYFLWNAIAAGVFGAPELTFWQSVGLLMLTGLITGGFRVTVSKKD